MNTVLFYSSFIMLISLLPLLYYYYRYEMLYFIILFIAIIGIIFALYNHYSSCSFSRYCDRIVIFLSLLLHLYILYKYYDHKYYSYIIISVVFYIIAKINKDYYMKSLFHILAHTSIVYYHFIILLNYPT